MLESIDALWLQGRGKKLIAAHSITISFWVIDGASSKTSLVTGAR